MELLDTRRLTGPNLLWDLPGIILEVKLLPSEDAQVVFSVWSEQTTALLSALGLPVRLKQRTYPGGISLAFAAPIDSLYACIDVGERSFEMARAKLAGEPGPVLAMEVAQLAPPLQAERDARLLALAQAAQTRGINFCGDDEWTTIGMGRGGKTWVTPELPDPKEVDLDALEDVPSVMVTGTNGKSTTVRLLVAMVRAAKLVPGASSTDWIQVGDEMLDKDDWSGPGGARAVLKDPRVDMAILETARGGMLRRGLAVSRVDVAVITNVAHDHMGEMGVHSLADLTEVKFIVERAGDHLVLNADDPEVRRRGAECKKPITWVSLNPEDELVRAHLARGGTAALLEGEQLVVRTGETEQELLPVSQVPMTLGGLARYNIQNALCAAAAALQMGLPIQAVRAGLRDFDSNPESNPGRLNDFQLGEVRALVDFAHNPHGLQALMQVVAGLPHKRFGILLGQAGDRDDESIIELARITAQAKPDLVIVKHMTRHLRGREEGEVVRLLHASLFEQGLTPEAVQEAPTEIEALNQLLAWAQPGDLLVVLCHAERDAVLERLSGLQQTV